MAQLDWNSFMSFSEPDSNTLSTSITIFSRMQVTHLKHASAMYIPNWLTLSEKKAQNKSCHWGYTLSKSTNMYHIGINMHTIGIAFKVLICTF